MQGREALEGGSIGSLVHVIVQQRLAQHWKVIICQLKNKVSTTQRRTTTPAPADKDIREATAP